MPISGIGAPAALMQHWKAGTHGGTYGGGNAVATAAAAATIQVIRNEGLAANAAVMGDRLMQGLRDLQSEYPMVGDVRGRGLMVGTEFTNDGRPAAEIAAKVQQACIQRHLLLLTCGTYGNVIRWIPPLVVNSDQIDAALDVFNEALAASAS
jgi:4-aminobutyrate aminotransferase-like enzyme